MKPIELKMTAFGPYKMTETIRFEELKDNRLFVISGATGAGKTTIFDGICFALYGIGSGEDRKDTKMMRSDFASDDTHTCVELIFEVNQRRYRILRQLPHIKQGNKSATGEKYEFFEVKETGEVPVVERQIVSEINKKVEDIIGLSHDQFSQIVMLPQGEFRKLLTSSTENKEAILRKIFKTEPYKMMSEKLKEKKYEAESEWKKEEVARQSYIEQIVSIFPSRDSSIFQLIETNSFNIHQLMEALREESTYYREKEKVDKIACEEAYENHLAKQSAFHLAKNINERFYLLEEKEQKLEHLLAQKEVYAEKEERVKLAEVAKTIEPLENLYVELEKEEKEKEQRKEEATRDLALMKDSLAKITERYKVEEAKKDQREKSVEHVIQLTGFLPVFEELESIKNELMQYMEQEKVQQQKVMQIETNYQAVKSACSTIQRDIEKLEHSVDLLDEKAQALTKLQQHYELMESYKEQEEILQFLKKEEEHQRKLFLTMQDEYREQERKWINSQASILASKLVAGEACPVCGSTNHQGASPVVHTHSVDEGKLQSLREELSKQESSSLVVVAKMEQAQITKEHTLEQLEELQLSASELESVRLDLERLTQEVNELRADKEKLMQVREVYKRKLEELQQLEKEKQQRELEHRQLKSTLEQKDAVYRAKQQSIPPAISTLAELRKLIAQAKKEKETLEVAWEEVQRCRKEIDNTYTKADARLEHLTAALEELSHKRDRAEKQFNEAINQAGFIGLEAYQKAKMSAEERVSLQEECNEYKQMLHTLTEQVKDGKKELEGHEKLDLGPLEEELTELKESYERKLKEYNSSTEYAKAGQQLENKITDTSERIMALEERVHRIVDLYDTLRGQNPMKLSFERYIQIEYLEQIIHVANERLRTLSNGQFQLIRSERQETHGKQSGLGLDVYDAYTGQIRDVKTLSGGEKFNASLCLALGMADVIQGHRGSVRVETMFIDEGFGSLDEESLNKAIHTLIDLQKSGRMIGVISHVAELKAAIPAVLEVEKLKEGYSKTKFIIK